MRVAVYPGSFDPLHIGHLAILRALSSMPRFDLTYLVVSPQNPFKNPEKALNASRRYDDAVKAVSRYPGLKVRVDDIELDMEAPHYSIRTLDALKAREPENDFTLVIGADNLAGIRRWKDYRRILSEYGAVVFPRRGYEAGTLREALLREALSEVVPAYRIDLMDAPLVDVSSTEIREAAAAGEDTGGLLM